MALIENLNADCVLKIVEYLNLEDQLKLWKSSEPASRLRSLISYIWQRHGEHTIESYTFDGDYELLNEFLQCIRLTVSELTLQYLTMDQLERWRGHTFPNMRQLTYLGDETSDIEGDADIAILVDLFPQLEAIGVSGNTTGNHISRWRNIRRLDLQLCWYLSPQAFEDICQNLRLQTLSIQWQKIEENAYVRSICMLQELEELELDIVYLSRDNISQLLGLPKLKTLRLHDFDQLDDLLWNIGSIRGQDVLTAAFSNNIWMRPTEVLAKLRNLRCLTLVDDEGCAVINFSTIIKCFPLLEQLHLENSRIWVNADGIWDVLLASPRLRELSISNHVLYDEFFAFNKSTMNRALNQRTEPLTIHFYKTGMEDMVSKHFKHPNLNVSFSATSSSFSQLPGECTELEFERYES
ncbi:uncharacterized protein LOC6731243 isoform X1 [Drosophila simulans]|uniref:GD22559 n=2 Tax=Drosophila simulans TaxID=7240 RepID=B4Q4Z5_DROSI|nr:uncharacterized protein LOC6731243 isoform X1 [Drosophila simulans]EDX03987.1 GD22559 [Drosophila simulans]KMY88565.1 uncharacterized protein Dsimw501_GD22559 [Drosophila simulans]